MPRSGKGRPAPLPEEQPVVDASPPTPAIAPAIAAPTQEPDPSTPELLRLQGLLEEAKQKRDTIEAEHKDRAKTPLALTLQAVSCTFASCTWPANRTMPVYNFGEVKCPFGKSAPDQDCRDCSHVQLIPYGSHLPPHERRYFRHGMVIPIENEERAEHLAHMLDAMDMRPLRRVDAEINQIEQLVQQEERRIQDQRNRELENQQRGMR